MQEMIVSNADTINSQTLLQMVNEARKLCGEPEVRNNKFIEKILDELDGEFYTKSVKPSGDKGGRPVEVVEMTYKQAMRVAARESKAVRRSLIDQLEELQQKALAAPQQQIQLIPGTPEHFAACYRAYFGEPVQNALTNQQQHTEPVEIPAPAVQREHFPIPRDMITISEVREKYFNNKDVLMQLIVSFGVRSELHHYGYTPDLSAPMADGLIYDRRQLLAILAALRATSYFIKHGGKFLANPALPDAKFTFKRVPTLRDGITADDITSAVEVLLLMK